MEGVVSRRIAGAKERDRRRPILPRSARSPHRPWKPSPRQRRRIPGRPGWNRKEWGGRRNRGCSYGGCACSRPRAVMMATAFLQVSFPRVSFPQVSFETVSFEKVSFLYVRSVSGISQTLPFLPRKRGCSAVMYENYESYDTGSKRGKGSLRARTPDQSASTGSERKQGAGDPLRAFPVNGGMHGAGQRIPFLPVFRQRKKAGTQAFR